MKKSMFLVATALMLGTFTACENRDYSETEDELTTTAGYDYGRDEEYDDAGTTTAGYEDEGVYDESEIRESDFERDTMNNDNLGTTGSQENYEEGTTTSGYDDYEPGANTGRYHGDEEESDMGTTTGAGSDERINKEDCPPKDQKQSKQRSTTTGGAVESEEESGSTTM